MTTVKLGGRELALAFTMETLDAMELLMGRPIDLQDIKETVVDGTQDRRQLVKILLALAREGAALKEEDTDIDQTWISRHMRPGDIPRMRIAVMDAVTEGMRMETAEGDNDEEIDAVLEEIKKNQEPGE